MAPTETGDPLLRQAGKYLGLGLTWALSTALFLYLGTLLDKGTGTEPLFTLTGAFVGATAGFYNLYHHLTVDAPKRSNGEADEREDRT